MQRSTTTETFRGRGKNSRDKLEWREDTWRFFAAPKIAFVGANVVYF